MTVELITLQAVLKGSWDLVTRVIIRVIILITPIKVLITLLTKSHDPPSSTRVCGDPWSQRVDRAIMSPGSPVQQDSIKESGGLFFQVPLVRLAVLCWVLVKECTLVLVKECTLSYHYRDLL